MSRSRPRKLARGARAGAADARGARGSAAGCTREEAAGKAIYPPRGQRLRALELTPLDAVKVVILGQDPYHGPGPGARAVLLGARGRPGAALAGQHLQGARERPRHARAARTATSSTGRGRACCCSTTALTVEAGKAGSHAGKGWEAITDAAVAAVAAREEPSVFILWGSHARNKAAESARARAGHAPPGADLAAPEPAVGAWRVLRLEAVQQGQRVSRGARGAARSTW